MTLINTNYFIFAHFVFVPLLIRRNSILLKTEFDNEIPKNALRSPNITFTTRQMFLLSISSLFAHIQNPPFNVVAFTKKKWRDRKCETQTQTV